MGQSPERVCALYCSDNLPVLRSHLADESVDLIYLDPPFYSQRTYQVSFTRSFVGQKRQIRVPAFVDTWRWDVEVELSYAELLHRAPAQVVRVMTGLCEILGKGSFLAYLVMMAARLVEFHRVLKSTGSVYLHCDSSASHYLKILLDAVFGMDNFRNEIVWGYKTGGASHRYFARKHDLIFFYSKSEQYIFHAGKEKSYMMHRYGFKKSNFLSDARGEYTWVYMKDVWEMPALGAADGQRLGYPTQKPEALLERIIQASSNVGEVVLDPFCGSGTTLAVAQRLGRKWLGIEKHYLGIAYQRYRLTEAFPGLRYTFAGGPTILEEVRVLARADPTQFRWWALALVGARPVGGGTTREKTERDVDLVHGQCSAHAGTRAHFLVAVVVAIQWKWLRRLPALLHTNKQPGLLIITLESPSQGVLAHLADLPHRAGPSAGKIEVLSVADLLEQTLSLPLL